MWVLGINWRFHDASAALVDGDGKVLALAEEERYVTVATHASATLRFACGVICTTLMSFDLAA
jgi:predicted NodU family carbamoyl transferase